MGEGRAVEGRKANPPVCLATPLLTDSPKAFLTKNSFCVITFLPGLPRAIFAKGSICINALLPGTALRVECDVTHSKQTTATLLPGSRFAHCRPRTSLPNALSNRELELLEPRLTHRKQTIGPRSNRELSTNPCFCISEVRRAFTSRWPFLTGSGSQTGFAVTNSKQTAASFLTGSRIARRLRQGTAFYPELRRAAVPNSVQNTGVST